MLVHLLVAIANDDSGQPDGTPVVRFFPLYTQEGFTATYGSLVCQIGSGAIFLIGTHCTNTVNATGQLALYYWDSNNDDNSGSIAATISASAAPGPIFGAGLPGLVMALGGLIAWRRRRRAAA